MGVIPEVFLSVFSGSRRRWHISSSRAALWGLLVLQTGCAPAPIPPDGSNAVAQPPPGRRGDETVNSFLEQILREHGVESTTRDGWIHVKGKPSLCGAVVQELHPTPSASTVQIDVVLRLPEDRVLVESFAGIGETTDEAVAEGLRNFAGSSFHVLLSAFYRDRDEVHDGKDDDSVERESWTIQGTPRRVVIGDVTSRGRPPDSGDAPLAWFNALTDEIQKSNLPRGTHWVRCYYCQMDGKAIDVEVLLDNDVWTPVQSAMERYDWPTVKDIYSVRVFLVIQDEPTYKTHGQQAPVSER